MNKMAQLAVVLVGLVVACGTARGQWHGGPPPGPPPGYGGGWYGMAGCGLGSMIFGPINTPGAQILAATTNSSFGFQTFGITSGTSNCVSGGVVAANRRQQAFAEVNFKDLKHDMASGGGEFLTSFAVLLGCDGPARPKLARVMQAEYETLLPSASTTADQLVTAINLRVSGDPELAVHCPDARPPAGPVLIASANTSPRPSPRTPVR